MTSEVFIKEVANVSGMTLKAVREMTKTFESVLKDVVARGESVKFADINISVKDVDAHVGRNPATGESIEVPASRKVVVKPSSTLKKIVK